MVVKEKCWYSNIYRLNNYGFYVSKYNNKYYLGYKHAKGRSIEVKINKETFNILKKEWK